MHHRVVAHPLKGGELPAAGGGEGRAGGRRLTEEAPPEQGGQVAPLSGKQGVDLHIAAGQEHLPQEVGALADAGVKLVEGVYAGLLGPTYETAAEVRALKILGADYVGMSTVCEAITAHALGMEMLGLTIVTNKAGLSGNAHGEVLAMADDTGEAACSVIMGVLRNLGGK